MPAQSTPKLDDLLRVLNTATDLDALQWEKTADEDTFRTVSGNWTIRISKEPYESRYMLSLLDNEGILLDECETGTDTGTGTDNNKGVLLEKFQPSAEENRLAMEALYKKARSRALNLDWKLKGLFDHLKTLAGES